jgi:[ribosomal protein S5]-alanine N-acetyltransferase
MSLALRSICIESPRLLLREYKVEDTPEMEKYLSDPQVLRYFQLPWSVGGQFKVDQRFIDRLGARRLQNPRCYFDLAITDKVESGFLGGCSLYVFSEENREASLAYWLAPQFWSKGYATEAAKMLLWLGFTQAGLHRIFAICDVNNTASSRVLEKAGMEREGKLREHLWHNNNWRSSYLYAVLVDQWKQSTASASNHYHFI